MSEDELEELLNHAAAGARHAALESVVAKIRAHAGEQFANGRDQLARQIRAIAEELDPQVAAAKAELQKHIDKATQKR
jgi:F0F1-type ATP synthase membrane subunit b/b'